VDAWWIREFTFHEGYYDRSIILPNGGKVQNVVSVAVLHVKAGTSIGQGNNYLQMTLMGGNL